MNKKIFRNNILRLPHKKIRPEKQDKINIQGFPDKIGIKHEDAKHCDNGIITEVLIKLSFLLKVSKNTFDSILKF